MAASGAGGAQFESAVFDQWAADDNGSMSVLHSECKGSIPLLVHQGLTWSE